MEMCAIQGKTETSLHFWKPLPESTIPEFSANTLPYALPEVPLQKITETTHAQSTHCIMNTTLTLPLLVNMLSSQHYHHCIAPLSTPLILVEQMTPRYLNKLLKSNIHKTQVDQTSHCLKETCSHYLNQAERAITTFKSNFDKAYYSGSNFADSNHLLADERTTGILDMWA